MPDHQAVVLLGQDVAHRLQPCRGAGRVGGVEDLQSPDRLGAQLHRLQQRQLADARLAADHQPLARAGGRLHLPAGAQPEGVGADHARQGHPGRGPVAGALRLGGTRHLDVDDGAAPRVPSPTGWLNIRATAPEGRSTSTDRRRSPVRDSRAWASRAVWSAGSSTPRAWSLRMTVSSVTAKTIPGRRRHRRRYSCSSSSCWAPAPASSAWRICSAVFLASVISSGPASFDQHVKSMAPDGPSGDGVADGDAGTREPVEVLGVVLVPEDVGGAAHLQGGADAVGPDLLLGVAEARGQVDVVEAPVELAVAGLAGQHQPRRVGQDDAHRLVVQLLAQLPQDGLRGARERGVEVHLGGVVLKDPVGGDLQVAGTLPRGEDGAAHVHRVQRLGGQEAQPVAGDEVRRRRPRASACCRCRHRHLAPRPLSGRPS